MLKLVFMILCGFVHWLHPVQVQNCFKIKKDAPLGMKSPPPKTPPRPNGGCPLQSPDSSFLASSQTLKEAAEVAAYRVADAQNKEILAADAAKEADRLSKLAEESEKMLELVTEWHERGTEDKQPHLLTNKIFQS